MVNEKVHTPKYQFINGLYLKIIGLVLMTIDHIGLFFFDQTTTTWVVMRSIGRLAFPIFVLLAIEALFHSRKIWRYILILAVVGVISEVFLAVIYEGITGNIFIDLSLGVLACYLIKRKDYYSFLAILPGAYLVLSDAFPRYFFSDYGTYGLLTMLSFYAVYEVTELIIKRKEYLVGERQKMRNWLVVIALITLNLVFYLVYRVDYSNPFLPFSFNIQSWVIFASIFIVFYNGKRGYSNQFLKYSFYAYYPAHIALLYLILTLIS